MTRSRAGVMGRHFAALIIAATLAQPLSARVFSGSIGVSVESFPAEGERIVVERFNPGIPGPRPAVIVLHGADAFTEYGEAYRTAGRDLAKAGYVAFLIHYMDEQGITDKRSLADPKLFTHWMRIINASIRYAAAQDNVDPCRIGLGGFSLGAYLALSIAATNPQVKAVVEFFGGLPAQIAASTRRMPPVLILHGTSDTRVPVSEAYRLAAFLQAIGTPYDMKVFPGAGHDFAGKTQEDAAKKALEFLDCHL